MSEQPTSRFDRGRDRIERGFARWGAFCHDHPWWIITTLLVAVVYFSTWLPTMEVDTSNESYLRETDPARVTYKAFQDEFGKDERLVILVESNADIVNDAFLRQLRAWHERLEAVPQVDKVDSLINARWMEGRGDELLVEELLEDWPQSAAEFDALRSRIAANPLYQNHFVSPDLRKAALIVTPDTYTASYSREMASIDAADFDFASGFGDDPVGADSTASEEEAVAEEDRFITDQEIYAMIDEIRGAKADFARPDFQISISGSPFIMHQLTFILGRDMFLFSGVGIVLISVLLFAVFRRWVMVVLPITVSALSLYFTFVLMCFFGMVITTAVQILPSLLLAIGVGNSVHIFTVYFQAIDRGDDKRQALQYALGHSGFAVLMTGLTTAGGLVSFITADLKPVGDIGIMAPVGILSALLFSLALLPALIAVTPFRKQGLRDDSSGPFQRFLSWCADVSTGYPKRVAGIWFVLIAVSLVLVSQIRPSHYPLNWFPEGFEVREATETIDAHFGGATFSEIIVDTGERNGLHDPELLHAVDRALRFMDELNVHGVQSGKAVSLIDINKELHQALNENDPAYYAIPDSRELIAQELLLFENSSSDDLDDLVDTSFSKMRITAKMPFVDGVLYPDYLDAVQSGFRDIIGDRAELTFTGVIMLLAGSVKVLISDTIKAYSLAFLIVAPLMMLLVGSVRTGLISMIPNLAPVILTMALMPLLGIPLDAFTLLVGSIALGLAVDDTIHFMHNFHRYYAQTRDARTAVRETLRTTGKALMITSMVLSLAFFVNLMGTMDNLKHFGLLTGVCIIVAFLADVLLAPALMTLLTQWKERKWKEQRA
ncbi:efflux RND transporter permease subunit [Algiphilus sp.]|uniref:efflux RND transporter permease subunit n=1 Tax=Algiphilus sp. TaxID=1872431 RepID=UPI003B5230C7